MKNEVYKTLTPSITPARTSVAHVSQYGEHSVYAGQVGNLNVTVNVNALQPGTANSAAQMIAVQNFSKEYYQLLVTCEEDAFQNNYVTVSPERALSRRYVPPEILGRCSSLSEQGIAELKKFPALICMENEELHGNAGQDQCAVYAYITCIKKEGHNVKVAFQPIASIPQKILCDKKNAIYFDLSMDCAVTTLNRSAWSVHRVNLFEAFDEAGIANVPRPM